MFMSGGEKVKPIYHCPDNRQTLYQSFVSLIGQIIDFIPQNVIRLLMRFKVQTAKVLSFFVEHDADLICNQNCSFC